MTKCRMEERSIHGGTCSFTKTLLIMKFTMIFLTIACLNVAANGFSQHVTFSGKNVSFDKVLAAVRKQTGYRIWYRSTDLASAKPVSIEANEQPLLQFLEDVFKNQPLKYVIESKTINVYPAEIKTNKDTSLVVRILITAPPEAPPVTGRVLNKDGQPLEGASIRIRGSKKGTSADVQGRFTIEAQPGDELVISYSGYSPKVIRLTSADNIPAIVLDISDSKLDEVQIIAYGKSSSRLLTGNVSTVKAADIEKSPVNNVLMAIQGRVPGIFIEQSSGFSGASMKVRIQGQNSILNGNDPLYVVDGVPYPAKLTGTINNIQGFEGGSPLSFINPSDIESVSVLKDADATSIYGSQAANGAILITTKKGKSGKSSVDVHFQEGVGRVARKMKMLNTRQYINMRWQAIKNDGIDLNSAPFNEPGWQPSFFDLLVWDTTRYTDWQKELLDNAAQYTDASITFSGGNKNTTYLFGGNYHRESSVQVGRFPDQRASIHFNVSNTSNDQRLKLNFSGVYLKDNNRLPTYDLTPFALTMVPNAPALYNANGDLNWEYHNGASTFTNPLSSTFYNYTVKTDNLIGNASIGYQLFDGLTVKADLGYSDLKSNELTLYPKKGIEPTYEPAYIRASIYGNGYLKKWSVEPQVTYAYTKGKSSLDAFAGMTFQKTIGYRQAFKGWGYASDEVMEDILAASQTQFLQSAGWEYAYNAVFGRLNYNYDNKYLVSLSARTDGSSRFGAENKFHNFASIAGAWIFSSEKFMDKFGFLSFGKLRASYGTTGSDQIGEYSYLSLYNNINAEVPYQSGSSGLFPTALPNPYLQWETTRKLQFGLDLGFMNDRILLNLNYNHNRSSNQLLGYVLPPSTGFYDISANFPAVVQNTGWEIVLTTTNVKSKNFNWTTSFNITIPRNKLVAFSDIETSSYASHLMIGRSVNISRYSKLIGVNPVTGNYEFLDKDGKPTSELGYEPENRPVIKDTDPKFYGGLENIITYKGFQLSFLFNFVSKVQENFIFGSGTTGIPGGFWRFSGNQPASILGAWGKSGDATTIQKFSQGFYMLPGANISNSAYLAVLNSDKANKNIIHARLRNLSLSWQFPEKLMKKAHFQNARVFVQGQNLLTFVKDYYGMDPETGIGALPPLRVITMGVNIVL